MDRQAIVNQLTNIIEDYLKDKDFDLIDVIYRQEGRDFVLRVLVDRPAGGITVDECADINSAIGMILEEKAILENDYVLEVSSPGLDRPLKTKKDFSRCLNKEVRFFLRELVEGKLEWVGIVSGIGETSVDVDVKGKIIKIEYLNINKARQELF
ncbi:MAG: ribosome maturation factor RimP [Candidatus Omnitrophica bacterium]|jgi:ribosome maturation factor RimP|nr:ribosome maturation factor RimP [Candidatus Omnitrophota bacterium]